MLLREIHAQIDMYLDKISTESYPEIHPIQKDRIINNAIVRLVKTRYGKNNIYKAGFEEIQKRTDELTNLVMSVFPLIETITQNTYRVSLNTFYTDASKTTLSDAVYWFFLRCDITINNPLCGSLTPTVKLVQQDDLSRVLKDPFNKPNKDKVIIYFEGDYIYIKTNNSTVTDFKLTFLKEPRRVAVDLTDATGASDIQTDLPSSLSVDIIKFAVEDLLDIIESPRQNFNQQINNLE